MTSSLLVTKDRGVFTDEIEGIKGQESNARKNGGDGFLHCGVCD
jgi:hypothetical protein